MRRIILTTIAAIAASASVPAIAQDLTENTAAVDYGELDLSNPEHMRTLDKRLLSAAKKVCDNASWANRNCVSRSYKKAKRTLKARQTLALVSRD